MLPRKSENSAISGAIFFLVQASPCGIELRIRPAPRGDIFAGVLFGFRIEHAESKFCVTDFLPRKPTDSNPDGLPQTSLPKEHDHSHRYHGRRNPDKGRYPRWFLVLQIRKALMDVSSKIVDPLGRLDNLRVPGLSTVGLQQTRFRADLICMFADLAERRTSGKGENQDASCGWPQSSPRSSQDGDSCFAAE